MSQLNGIVRGNANDVATNETINSNTIYNLQDLRGISLTNEQMTNALTHAQDGFFKKDEIRFCTDNGTYSKDHFYQFTITGTSPLDNVASWTDLGTLGGGKTLITLTGESGTLTDSEIAKVLDNSAVVEFVLDGNVYKFSEKQTNYAVYSSVVYPTQETKEERVIYIQISSDAVNYKSWSLELENGDKPIITQNVEIESADWVSDGITGYSYSADIEVEGATDKDVSIVTFDPADADSGDFASVCDTAENAVTIYSKTARDVTIPVVLTVKTNTEKAPDPVFGNNSWAKIKSVMQSGNIPSTWLVGDTKEFTGKDNNTYHAMLYDKQIGRYDYSDGSGRKTNCVIGFVELPNIITQWNTTQSNIGGLADSQIRKNLNGLTGVQTNKNFMTNIIPDDLAGLLEEVNIVTATGGTTFTDTSESANKLFPPCFANVRTTTNAQYVAEGTLWDYYITHTSDSDRKKALVTNLTSYQDYWMASPVASFADNANFISSDGRFYGTNANQNHYVAPHWAW